MLRHTNSYLTRSASKRIFSDSSMVDTPGQRANGACRTTLHLVSSITSASCYKRCNQLLQCLDVCQILAPVHCVGLVATVCGLGHQMPSTRLRSACFLHSILPNMHHCILR